jgi:putative ABC transport system permease protein
MFGYYLNLALRSFKRNKVLTALMVLAIALGIGTSMTTLTVYQVLAADPLPDKSDRLYYVQLDPEPLSGYQPGNEPALQLTRYDAEALLREKRGKRQAMMSAGNLPLLPDDPNSAAHSIEARFTSADFFAMFDVPFAAGQPWTAAEDQAHARVAVISQALALQLFGSANPVGQRLRSGRGELRIIGVLGHWHPNPRFYDLTTQHYGEVEQVFLPLSTALDLQLDTVGELHCWGASASDDPLGNLALNAPCSWLQYWVELDGPQQAADYRNYLANYSAQQRAAGRYQRPPNARLHALPQWLQLRNVVPADVHLQLWLALGFLVVCVLNTVGLMLAKFLRRSGEISVRRALGAARNDIFAQCLVEAGCLGLVGGVFGLALALLGLWLVRQQPTEYAALAQMNLPMLLTCFFIAVLSSLFAGLVPALRAMRIAPALQLKSQ